MKDLKNMFLQEVSKDGFAKEIKDGISIGNSNFSCDYYKDKIYLSKNILSILNKDDIFDKLIKYLKASFLGRGTGVCWISLSKDGAFANITRQLDKEDVIKNLKNNIENFIFIAENIDNISGSV